MFNSVLAEGAKTWRMGRCTLHEGRWATEMLPKGAKWIQKVAQKEPKGTQHGATGCKKGAKGSQNEQKVSQMAPTWVQFGSKFDPEIDPNAFWRKGCQKAAKKVPKHRNYNSKIRPKNH